MRVNRSVRTPGRPRNEAAGRAILAAARDLVVQYGYAAVTTQQIAEAAGTGKQTIYRRWPSKAELVLAAFLEHAKYTVDLPATSSVPTAAEVKSFLRRMFRALDETGGAVRSLMAYAQNDPEFRETLHRKFIMPRRRAFREILERGVARGEISADADVDAGVLAVYGAMWYRLLLGEPLTADFAERLTKLLFSGLSGR
jgi:AcrR family transcriptional regulator